MGPVCGTDCKKLFITGNTTLKDLSILTSKIYGRGHYR